MQSSLRSVPLNLKHEEHSNIIPMHTATVLAWSSLFGHPPLSILLSKNERPSRGVAL